MQRTTKSILALAAVPLVGVAALWASPATPSVSPRHVERAQLVLRNGGEDDRLVIDDLDTLKPGESRTYLTENGKSVLAARDEKGVELDVDGRKIRLADDPEALPGAGAADFALRRIEVDDDGGTRLRIERQGAPVGLLPGEGEATLFGAGALIDRLDRNPKFQSLDATTQQLVREAIRESTPAGPRLGVLGHGLKIEIVGEDGREREPK